MLLSYATAWAGDLGGFGAGVLSSGAATRGSARPPIQLVEDKTAPARQTLLRPSPTIRPVLVSQDPAGDVGVSCYVHPQTYPNGYTETPRALPGQCVVEITDTLRIEFGSEPSPEVLSITGPAGYSRQISDPELYLALGTPLGQYAFSGRAGGKAVSGGFTVKPSSKKVAQLRYNDPEARNVDYLAFAGYSPMTTINVYYYEQLSFQANVGTGQRKWRLGRSMGSVVTDDRGEAKFAFDWKSLNPKRNYLIATDPFQENDLNSAIIRRD